MLIRDLRRGRHQGWTELVRLAAPRQCKSVPCIRPCKRTASVSRTINEPLPFVTVGRDWSAVCMQRSHIHGGGHWGTLSGCPLMAFAQVDLISNKILTAPLHPDDRGLEVQAIKKRRRNCNSTKQTQGRSGGSNASLTV
jgi:hypothetical protein